ncbi:MAG: S8 family serine peptidase [Bacteroidales bacterium]|jgi:subtilisin family serine protease/photosystem II stability/assembly factor-like uncharacterized protein|nr:S8 family serine peptidase [Bacteroidales bacterium]
MKTFIKVIFALVLILFPFVNTFAQAVNENSGGVYVKIADHVFLNVANENGKINSEDVYFLKGLIEKYQIKEVKMPFLSAKNDRLQRTLRINFNNVENIQSLLSELNSNPDIEYAEKVPVFSMSSFSADPDDIYYDMAVTGSFMGNDLGQTNTSWHLDLVNASEAWTAMESTNMNEVIVAVLDNAIWIDHPDLENKVVSSIDLIDGDNDPNPPSDTYVWSHGTHVAGLIAAENNNTIGIASIGNDNVKIMAVKLSADSDDGTTLSYVPEGIIWAADNGANVINVSWQTTEWSQAMLNAVNYAFNKGCVIVAPAGNNNDGTDMYYPAAFDNVIAVASCDLGNNKSEFSNYGEWVDVMAPGGFATSGNQQGIGKFSLLSTTYNTAGTIDGILTQLTGGAGSYAGDATSIAISGNYDIMSGTSGAAAITSGLCGLMLSVNPDLTPGKLKELLKASCDNVDEENDQYVGKIGTGRINALEAVSLAIDMAGNDLVAKFEANTIFVELGGSVDFTDFSEGTPTSWEWVFENAIPSQSDEQNPTEIVFNKRGIQSVQLTVSDGTNSDTEIKTSYIIVGNQVENPDDLQQNNWIEQNLNFSNGVEVVDIEIPNQQEAWVLAADEQTGEVINSLSKTTNRGVSWAVSTINLGTGYSPVDLSVPETDVAWLLASHENGGGAVFNTVDGGETWTIQSTATFDSNNEVKIIKMFNTEIGFCVGNPVNDVIELFRTTDGGTTWTKLTNLPSAGNGEEVVARVGYLTGTRAWFGTTNGYIYRTADAGANWEKVLVAEDMELKAMSFYNVNGGFAYFEKINEITGEVDTCVLRRTANSGVAWGTVEFNGLIVDISSIPGKANNYIFIMVDTADNNVMKTYLTNDNAATFTTIDEDIYYTKVLMIDEDHGWVGGRVSDVSGGIYRWPEAPYFLSSAPRNFIEGDDFYYEIETYDENNKEITITVSRPPTWMTTIVDNGDGTGSVAGTTPTLAASDTLARYLLIVVASNGITSREQRDTINVRTSSTPPTFVSSPVLTGTTYREYSYDIEAISDQGKNLTLTATTIPSWAGLYLGTNGRATLSGVPVSSGQNRVVLQVYDGLFRVTQEFIIQIAPLSDVEDFGFGNIEIYPNPSSDILNITNCQGSEYEILDITGRILQKGKITNEIEKIDLTEFSEGNMFIKLYNNDKVYTTKVVKM